MEINKHKNEGKISNSRGITLVALIVTIVVLLILASITIASITGNDAPIDKAGKAKNATEIQAEIEELQQIIDNAGSKNFLHGNYSGSADTESIKTALTNYVKDTSAITGNAPWQIESKKSGVKYLINQDHEVIEMPEKTGSVTEMGVKVGDFINYDAGTWTQEEIDKLGDLYCGENLPDSTTPYKFGGFKAGKSRNDSISTYKNLLNTYYGWRILDIDNNGVIKIIHAGTSEGYFHPNETNAGYNSLYILKKNYYNSLVSSNALKRNWDMYENDLYAVKGSAHLIQSEELTEVVRVTGTYFWQANINNHRDLYFVNNNGQGYSNGYNYCFGIRPVVTLKAECLFQNTNDENVTSHNTQDTAWNLVI